MNPQRMEERRALYAGIRKRLLLLANERNMAKDDLKRALGLREQDLVDFAIQHRLSLDWLIRGDLKGLLRTVRRCA